MSPSGLPSRSRCSVQPPSRPRVAREERARARRASAGALAAHGERLQALGLGPEALASRRARGRVRSTRSKTPPVGVERRGARRTRRAARPSGCGAGSSRRLGVARRGASPLVVVTGLDDRPLRAGARLSSRRRRARRGSRAAASTSACASSATSRSRLGEERRVGRDLVEREQRLEPVHVRVLAPREVAERAPGARRPPRGSRRARGRGAARARAPPSRAPRASAARVAGGGVVARAGRTPRRHGRSSPSGGRGARPSRRRGVEPAAVDAGRGRRARGTRRRAPRARAPKGAPSRAASLNA